MAHQRIFRAAAVAASLTIPFAIMAIGIDPANASTPRLCTSTVHSDFNGDGHADVAVTELNESANGINGAVRVVYGRATGLVATGNQYLDGSEVGSAFTPFPADKFGESLATGDFNGDGCADLAVAVGGVISNDEPELATANGSIIVYYGSPAGLVTSTATVIPESHQRQ